MGKWEYERLNLNDVPVRATDLDLLNEAGKDGWELVALTSNNFAIMKRELEEIVHGSDERDGRGDQEVKVKYRDPETNETWSGRGRMANWLKRKLDAGEDINKYLV